MKEFGISHASAFRQQLTNYPLSPHHECDSAEGYQKSM
jgi:hypothetical protein